LCTLRALVVSLVCCAIERGGFRGGFGVKGETGSRTRNAAQRVPNGWGFQGAARPLMP